MSLFQQDMAAQNGQMGFFLGADDVQADAGFAMHPIDKFRPVGGLSAGFRCDGAGDVNVALA